jgi:hypothetical protein
VRTAGLALMAAGALVLGLAPSAGAATLGDAAWWWRPHEGPGGPPKPPHVPDGGLYVAGTPDGASAIAALRFTLEEGETGPVLTLDEVDPAGSDEEESPSTTAPAPAPLPVPPPTEGGGTTPKELDPVILACQAGSDWKQAEAGKWAEKPKVACGVGKVTGEREGTAWSWDLSDLQVKTEVDIVLVPGKVQGVGSTFQVAFEPPDDTSLTTVPGTSPVPIIPAGESLTPVPDSGGSAGFDDAGAGGVSATSGDPGTSFDAGDDTSESGPALSEDEQGLEKDAAAVENAQEQAQPASATTGKNARTLGIVVLVAGAALALFANQQPVPALRKLGPFGAGAGAAEPKPADPTPGGLGRFTRARSGPAPKL